MLRLKNEKKANNDNKHSFLLESDKFEFDILAISESKHKRDMASIVDITLPNFHPPISTPSEANKGGVLLYINKRIDKFKPDLTS